MYNSGAQTFRPGVELNQHYTKAETLQTIMDRYTKKDLPGIAMAVYSDAEGLVGRKFRLFQNRNKNADDEQQPAVYSKRCENIYGGRNPEIT